MSSKIPLSNGSISIDVTFPKYDWDFRVATPSNNILKDTINGIDASYNFGATSTVSDGAILDGTNDSIGLGIIDLSGSAQDYSYEMYFYVDSYTNADALFNFCNSSTGAWDGDNGINWLLGDSGSVDPNYRITDDYYRGDGRGTSGWQPLLMPVGSLVHAVMTVSNNSTGTGTAKFYQNNVVSSDRSWTRANGPYYNHNYICGGGTRYTGNELQMKLKYFRVYDYELSADQVSVLYSNTSSISPFSLANLRINYGDVYLAQTLNKTLDDYKAENIPLHDISFGAFTAINRLKETYIQGPVDISGDLVVRSNKNTFYDISASKIGFSSGYDYITTTDASYAIFASTTSSYTNTNIADPKGVSNTTSRYGRSVDMTRDGNYIAAGVLNEGRAHVWKVDDMTVTQLGGNDEIVPNTGTGRFGTIRITGDGSKAVVCNHSTTGNPNQFTYIWSNPGSTTGSWSEVTTARVTNSSYTEGWRVSMSQDGNVLIKGPSETDNPISTFIWSTDQWVSPGNIPARASGTYLLDNAINYDGTICVVGGHKYDSDKGYIAAYKYSKATTETDGTWEILGDYIDINESDGSTLLYWGEDVCINDAGDIIAAVAIGDGTNVTYDLIKAYKYSTPGVLGGTWTQLGDDMKPTPGISSGGTSIQNMDMNSDGSIIAYGNDVAGTNDGAVFVYQYSLDPQIAGGTWSQIAFINRPTTSSNLTDWNFGSSVRLNGFGNKMHVGISPGGSTNGVGYTYLINIDHTVDYRTATTTSTPKIVTNDLSLNNRFFVGGDASFNGNVTIQGDLSFDSALSGTIVNSAINIGSTDVKTFTQDISLNANLAIHGKTTVKNDLYLNAYTDVSANPVLSDGTYLKNMKMDKLNHRYIMDISRSAPFSTLTSNTLPSEIWDNSSNSGICISADGKHIRTVNSGDLSSNALSYYSNDYGNSFHEDEELSQKFNYFDISINTASQYSSDFKFGSDKVFMSYNGQHQLVPRGISNIGTYDDYLYTSNDFGKNWNLRKSSTLRTFNYTVTANSSSNYIFNGETYTNAAQPTVNIGPNETVIFTIDTTTNGSHPFKIGTSIDGDEITDSTISSVTSGSNQVITFTPTSSGTFYYYCSAHTGMGNSITVANYNIGPFSSNSWFWNTGAVSADGKHMYVSGSAGFWKSSDYGRVWNQTSADSSFNFMSISADGKLVYGVNERKVYGSTDYGNTFSTLYTDSYTSDSSYCGISTSGNGKYITIAADNIGSNIYMSSDYGNSFDLKPIISTTGNPTASYDWDFRIATPSGNTVTDSIGGLTATYVSGVTSSIGGGAYFAGGTSDGNSPYINLQAFPTGGGYSYEAYVKFDGDDYYARVFDFGDESGTNNNNYLLARNGGNATIYWGVNNNGNFAAGSITNGVYTHLVAIVSSSGVLTLYQDGVVVSSGTTTPATTVQTRANHFLGRSNWDTDATFKGNMHYFRVYNSELSSSDVTTLYQNRESRNINCGMSHSGKIVLNSNYISFDYGNNFTYVPNLISNNLSNRDTFYSKANMEYILDPSNNALLQIPYKSAIFQDIYSVGSIKAGSTTYSSDYRLKENVQPLTDNETVNELHPVKYYNTNLKKNDYGLLAHELQEKYPFLVSGEKDGAENQSINYNGLISLLVHEVKNLKKEYQELVEMKNNA
jgi:plastocyanin